MDTVVIKEAVGTVVKGTLGRPMEKLVKVLEYICCYASKLDSLRKETGRLNKKLEDINGLINDAMRNGREILQEPSNWVDESKSTLKDADALVKDSSGLHPCCWPFSIGDCNCKRRYDVADKAVKLLEDMDKLMKTAGGFNEGTVSKRPRPQRLPPTYAYPYKALPSMEGYLATLKAWLVGDHKYDIIGVYGLKGAGKTLLVKKLAVELDSDQHDGEVNDVVYISGGMGGTADGLKSIQQGIAERVGLVLQHEDVQERGIWLTARLLAIRNVVFIIDDVDTNGINFNHFGVPWSDQDKKGCRFVVVSSSLNICKQTNTQMELEVESLSTEESLHLFKELVNQKHGEGTSNTFQTGIDHISSTSTWSAGDVIDYYNNLYFGSHQPQTESMASSSNTKASLPDKLISLRQMMQQLCSKADDIQHELRNEELQARKKRKSEVTLWLEQVTSIESQVQSINEKEVDQVMESVEKLLKQSKFPRGLLLDDYKPEGLRLVTQKLEGSTPSTVQDRVWGSFVEGKTRVGIYGMGGVGKTSLAMHINNKILKKTDLFDRVYYVTVSRDTSVYKLQSDIAKALGLKLEFEDEPKRAALLNMALEMRKGSLLILDDVWEDISMETVGVSVDGDGCKLLITTRKGDVCHKMNCFPVKMDPLSDEDSWDLFKKKLGNFEQLSDEVKVVAELVAKECDGLPLGIVTMAGSMRGETSVHVWRDALNRLRNPCIDQVDMENKVFHILRFSYDRLNDEKHRKCFLYCALYPEDHIIMKEELISQYIALGLLDGSNRQAKKDMGHTLLNGLVNASLLEREDRGDGYVKMHDLVRDMAIKIIGSTGMLKAGKSLKNMPGEMEWIKDLEWVSLMNNNDMEDIEGTICPYCPEVSVLLLQRTRLRSISRSFFERMKGLKVLNLSRTSVSVLPDSVCDLANLNSMLLSDCGSLCFIPSVAKLIKLKELVLRSCSMITKLPEGMEKLVSLEHLDLKFTSIRSVREGLFCKLFNLESFFSNYGIIIPPNHLESLRNLQSFFGQYSDVSWFNQCVNLKCFDQWKFYSFSVGDFSPIYGGYKSMVDISRGMSVTNYSFSRGIECLLVPHNVQSIQFNCCNFCFRSLLEFMPSVGYATGLVSCVFRYCKGIEYIIPDTWSNPPEGIRQLELGSLADFVGLIREEVVNPCTFSFGGLRKLEISECSKLKRLWLLNLDLPNLEEIHVTDCEQMEEVFATTNGTKIELPKLHSLHLKGLSELRSIWGSSSVFCPQLVKLKVRDCPMVRKVGLLSHNLPSLEEIRVHNCEQIEEIFAGEDEGGDDAIQLPNLKKLELYFLPELRSISRKTIVCNSLQLLSVSICEEYDKRSRGVELENCPISVSSLSSLNPHPVLEARYMPTDWWESLDWNDPATKVLFKEHRCLIVK